MIVGIHTQNTVPKLFSPMDQTLFFTIGKNHLRKTTDQSRLTKIKLHEVSCMFTCDRFFFYPTIDKILFSMILDISWWKNKRAPFVFSSIKMMFWTQIAKHQMAENGDQNMKWTRHMKQNIIGIWFSDRPRQFVTRPVW